MLSQALYWTHCRLIEVLSEACFREISEGSAV